MSKKKANQFMCSSMMLPEHREKLAERSFKAPREEKRFPGAQTPEELARCLNQSFFTKVPVDLIVEMGKGVLPLTGAIVDAHEGQISLRANNQIKLIALESIIHCQPVTAPREQD